MTWYIDAWCPVDGLAFASRRRPSILHKENNEGPLDAEEIVYICPPFFEPEQIGNLATALAATRGHFQTGFYLLQQEVAFPALGAVIETVKRVYRGGGANSLPGEGLPLPVTPVDRPSDAVRPESLVNSEVNDAWDAVKTHFDGLKPPNHQDLVQSTTKFLRSATQQGFFAKLALLSIAPALNHLAQNTALPSADLEALGRWISILSRMGLIVEIEVDKNKLRVLYRDNEVHRLNGFEEDLPSLSRSKVELQSLQLAANPLFSRLFDIDPQSVVDTMHRIPVPIDWPSPYKPYKDSRYAFVPTFGALFCLATASFEFLHQLSSPLHFVPIMFASMALGASWANTTRYSDNFEAVYTTACDWLARSLPTFSLGKEIDKAIHCFSIQDLESRVIELAKHFQ